VGQASKHCVVLGDTRVSQGADSLARAPEHAKRRARSVAVEAVLGLLALASRAAEMRDLALAAFDLPGIEP
jgi:hypothetical protein